MNPFFILTQIFFSLVAFSTSDYSLYVTHNLHVLNEVYVTPAAENLHAACRTIEGYSLSIVHYLKDLSASSSSHPTAPTSAGSNDSTPNSAGTEAKSNDEQLVTNDIMIFTTLEPRNTRCGVIRAEIDISEAAASPGKPFFSVRKKGRLTTFRYECRTVPSSFPFHARDVSSGAILVDAYAVEVPETPTLLPPMIATQVAQPFTEGQPVITSPPLASQAMPVRLAAPAPHIIIAIAVFLACFLTLAVHRKSRLAKARENAPLLPFTVRLPVFSHKSPPLICLRLLYHC
ncbi:hypothetical protein DFH11DRAFT_1599200 [Phellopilus nigrolimitatus]|nr:hypothetical protein DFH11DRAFT_1599200 [Phellopilus nigrolimitatus]